MICTGGKEPMCRGFRKGIEIQLFIMVLLHNEGD